MIFRTSPGGICDRFLEGKPDSPTSSHHSSPKVDGLVGGDDVTGVPPRLPPPLPNTAMSGGPGRVGGVGLWQWVDIRFLRLGSGEVQGVWENEQLLQKLWLYQKTVTGWWQLKHFWNFHPDVWGK